VAVSNANLKGAASKIAEVRSVLFRENRPKCQNRGSVISAKHEDSGRKQGEKAQIGEIATFGFPLFWGKWGIWKK
jgi:hypothetical protein